MIEKFDYSAIDLRNIVALERAPTPSSATMWAKALKERDIGLRAIYIQNAQPQVRVYSDLAGSNFGEYVATLKHIDGSPLWQKCLQTAEFDEVESTWLFRFESIRAALPDNDAESKTMNVWFDLPDNRGGAIKVDTKIGLGLLKALKPAKSPE
jgi:hypothetical protein